MATITPEFSDFCLRRVACSDLKDPRVESDPPYVTEEPESGAVLRAARTGLSNHSHSLEEVHKSLVLVLRTVRTGQALELAHLPS